MTTKALRRVIHALDVLASAITECASELRTEVKLEVRPNAPLGDRQPFPAQSSQPTNEILNTHEAACYLGIRPQTLAAWRYNKRAGAPKHLKIGRSVRYRRSDLEEYLQRSSSDSAPDDGL